MNFLYWESFRRVLSGEVKMNLGSEMHFREIIIPAWQSYLRSERRLTDAHKDAGDANRAGFDALRKGGAASLYLHHFSDIVLHERPSFLPEDAKNIRSVRNWVSGKCTMLRSEFACRDVKILADVADALKHSHLTHSPNDREVSDRNAVLAIGSDWGEMALGEGKYGGDYQVLILTKSGKRALSSVLQNVVDAWRRAMGLQLPSVGEP